LVSTERIALDRPGWALRSWRAADAPALARHANNPEVWRWMSDGFPHPYTLEIARHWVTRGHLEFGGDNWAIAHDDEAVGGCGIRPQDGHLRCSAEVGWWLAEPHWGQGITTLVARARAGNARSMRVAEKAGLVLEGVQRKSALKAGRVIDRHVFAAVRND
jgi:[ribosomal protein S5]-alanine N-acetyltransferase